MSVSFCGAGSWLFSLRDLRFTNLYGVDLFIESNIDVFGNVDFVKGDEVYV